MPSRKLIGTILIEAGLITPAHLEEALAMQKRDPRRIGRILLDMGLLDEAEFLKHLAVQLGVSFISLPHYLVDPAIARLLPERICRRHRLIAINKIGNRLTVAMDDPQDLIAIDDVQLLTGLIVKPMLASGSALIRILDEVYSLPTP
ncbi:MAG TPA: hypothetical protein VIV61_05570 [Candidatus Ozemobacteraceae bacterium]